MTRLITSILILLSLAKGQVSDLKLSHEKGPVKKITVVFYDSISQVNSKWVPMDTTHSTYKNIDYFNREENLDSTVSFLKYSSDSTYVTKAYHRHIDEKNTELITFTFWYYPTKNLVVRCDTFKRTKTILSKRQYTFSSQNNTSFSEKSFHWVKKDDSIYKSKYKKYHNGKLYSSFVERNKYSKNKMLIKKVIRDQKTHKKYYFKWKIQSVDTYGNQAETFVLRKDYYGKVSKKLLVYTREYY